MKKTNYSGKSKTDLTKALYEKRTELRDFQFGMAGAKTRNVKLGAATRKEIARILTALNKE